MSRRRAQYALAFDGTKPRAKVVREDTRKETDIQRDILRVLKLHPAVAWAERFNSRVVDVTDKRSKTGMRPMRMAFKGCSDILGQLKPRNGEVIGAFLAVEVKRPGGMLTEEQAAFLSVVNKNGGFGICARSVTTVLEELAAFVAHKDGSHVDR